jgi:hypothetical protein
MISTLEPTMRVTPTSGASAERGERVLGGASPDPSTIQLSVVPSNRGRGDGVAANLGAGDKADDFAIALCRLDVKKA